MKHLLAALISSAIATAPAAYAAEAGGKITVNFPVIPSAVKVTGGGKVTKSQSGKKVTITYEGSRPTKVCGRVTLKVKIDGKSSVQTGTLCDVISPGKDTVNFK